MKRRVITVLMVLIWSAVFLSSRGSAYAAGISVEIRAGYNLVVDSNVLSPSTYAPSVATVMGRFCNTTGSTQTNVFAYIGNFGANTPGIYASRGPGDPGFNAAYPLLAARPGRYSFTHVGGQLGTSDASRFLGNLAPGECKVQYWHITYPRRSNGTTSNDNAGPDPVWGATNVKTDDLWLQFDMWAKDQSGASTGNASWTMTMRNEISAMANKIKPNPNGQWFNTNTNVVLPGDTITSNGIDYELGVINQGFDNDGNLVPDYNAWLQPVGDPGYDPSCFRLIHTDGYLTISRSAMPDLIVPFDDQLYFTNLPTNNNGVTGRVFYTFMAMNGACFTGLTPYQEVASGYENEKFNGDYGTGIPPVGSSSAQVTINKSSAPTTVPLGTTTTYSIPFANPSAVAFGLGMSVGGTTPLVVTDAVPDGMQYVGGSATQTLTYVNTGVTKLYSTNSGVTWSGTDPGTVLSTWPANKVMIQWWLNDALPAGNSGSFAQFQATVPLAYTGTPFIDNCANGSLGNGVPFAQACATIIVPGNNSIGDFVWNDLDSDGVQDGGAETGIPNITVSLYYDANGNGVVDTGETLVTTASTNASGLYSFPNLPDGRFIVVVDTVDPQLPVGVAPTTPKSRAVALDPSHLSAAAVNDLTADFGFGPSLRVTKSLTSNNPAYVGDDVSFQIDLTNTLPGDGTASGFCRYNIWSTIAHTDNTNVPPGGGPTNAQWLNTANAINAPDSAFAATAMNDNTDLLGLSGFNMAGQTGNITNVQFVAYTSEVANLKATDNLFVRVFYNNLQLGTDYQYNGGTFFSGTAGSKYTISQDITGLRSWTWTDFNNNLTEMQLEGNKGGGGGNSGDIGLDAVAYVVTTDQICGSADTTISFLPLTDTYNSAELQFVSANPMPSSTTPLGTLTWNNLGPLYAGGTRTITLLFTALTPVVSPGTTNVATVTNPLFLNGRPANNGTDNAQVPIQRSGSIAGTVWADSDNSGWSGTTGFNAGDGRLPNVRVDLYRCVSNFTGLAVFPALANNQACTGATNDGTWVLVDSMVTNATGDYAFTGLRDGFYNVILNPATLPAGFTTNNAETNPAGNGSGITCGVCDNQWNTVAANLSTFNSVDNSVASDNITNVSFGYRNPAGNGGITGYVWNDVDQDGVWDSGEQPISGVTVYLCSSAANPCNAGSAIASTTTDANGFYSFNRAAGNYRVGILTPSGMSQSGDTDVPAANCGGSCDNQSNTITLPAQGVNGPFNFGYFGGLSIGDTVYMDWNGNGSQGAGEEGIAGAIVELYRDTNGNGVLDAGEPLLSTQTTNASGNYLFSNLPGNGARYVVKVNTGTLPASVTQTADPGEAGTCVVCDSTHNVTLNAASVLTADFGYRPRGYGSIGDYVWRDTNADGLQNTTELPISGVTVNLYQDQDGDGILDPEDAIVATTTTNASGLYNFANLPAGNFIVQVAASNFNTGQPLANQTLTSSTAPYNATQNSYAVSLAAGQTFLNADFGYVSSLIGDFIWQDNDGDGEQDPGEPGIPGVTVYLCTGSPCNAGSAVATAVTDASGLYVFGGLLPRTGANVYVVSVNTATLPAGGFTQTGDPDRTHNCAFGGTPACDNSTTLNLALGQVDRSRDFGYQPSAFIGDTLWIDADNDGVRDPGEAGIPNVTVRLCADAACTTVISTTSTDSNGNYSFGNVANGTYFVSVLTTDPDMPAGLTNTYDPDGTANSVTQVIVSGAVVTSVGGTPCVNCSLNADFGYRYVGTNNVSGTVFFDVQNNGGIYNSGAGDIPFANIPVYLYNSSGVLIATTTTNASGFYTFTNLPNGTFTVSINSADPSISPLTQRSEPDNLNCGACNNNATFVLNNANLINQDYGYFASMDCGDAPNSYNTLLANQGPCHVINGTYLGATPPDAETNGQPNGTATGDGADENGVVRDMSDLWLPSTTVQINVTVTGANGNLVAWFDWNNDGDFNDSGETVQYGAVPAGLNTLNLTIPASYTTGQMVNSRFRLYSGSPSSIASTGIVNGGEIEDYQWLFQPTAVTLHTIYTEGKNSMVLALALGFVFAMGSLVLIKRLPRRSAKK